MIKIAMKHWLFEVCIYQLFESLIKNFRMDSRIHNVSVGDRFTCITIKSLNMEIKYFNPKVVEVNDEFFIIEGDYFEECYNDEDDGLVSTGDHYGVEIYKNDATVKYLE